MLNKKLLEILACPVCKSSVKLKGDKIICYKCKKYYPVRDGIPVMLVDEVRDLEEREK